MLPLTEIHKKQLSESCAKHHVVSLSLFGSVLRQDYNPKHSDVDLLVEFEADLAPGKYAKNYFSFLTALEGVFQCKVDLITVKELKNPVLHQEIERTKVPLYAA